MKKIIIGLFILFIVGILFYAQKQVDNSEGIVSIDENINFEEIVSDDIKVTSFGSSGDFQIVNIKVDGLDYLPSEVTVQKGKPVKLIVDGTDAVGCVKYFMITEFNINTLLDAGENVFEFTPSEVGSIPFSCSMNMVSGTINVIDEIVEDTTENIDSYSEIYTGLIDSTKLLSYEPFLPGEELSFDSLSEAESTSIIDVADGEEYTITAEIVWKEILGQKVKMYAYNGMIPGVALRVEQGSNITLHFVNNIDWNTTIHWHGLRHDVKDDGVPGISQDPVAPGEFFDYTLYFPDEGIYWYHPHIREDIQQDMGLAGNMLVNPTDENYYNLVDREELLVFDDILMSNDGVVPFGKVHGSHSIMGRFGNVMLLNGETDYSLDVQQGEVVRFYLTNVANVRPFNISFGGAKMKLIGSDLGKYEQETFVDSIIIAPAERYIVEVFFSKEGSYSIENINPHGETVLGTINVEGITNSENFKLFPELHSNEDIISDIDPFREFFDKPVDYQIDLTVDMDNILDQMSLLPCHSMGGIVMGNCTEEERGEFEEEAEHGLATIEWEDEMRDTNALFTTEDLTWILQDHDSENQNMDIEMSMKVGDLVKMRLFNDPESMHPMQHPIHLHGQRFLVVNVDGEFPDNLVWKDTVLVPIGSTVDILMDVTNPGEWMMHCHIAEHLEAGMMASFMVTE